jgi:hypothetical protein
MRFTVLYISFLIIIYEFPEVEFMKIQYLLRFPRIILRVLRLDVSVKNIYITIQLPTIFAQGREIL